MKKYILAAAALTFCCLSFAQYTPSEGNLQSRKEFSSKRLGIFLHWGIYSTYAQGEWYLHTGKLDPEAYSRAAKGFYPGAFDPEAWALAFRESGAGYVTLTSRHHDGFSMWATAQSRFNVVDSSPIGRDLLGELTAAVKAQGLRMHYYYSLLDWIRPDYKNDYDAYFEFEKRQLGELLSYGPAALWFDGMWDRPESFPWRMEELYSYIHGIAPECLIGNNHHRAVIDGEDFQMFERDLPGENTAGYSEGVEVSMSLPLEMCQTMNGSWGYNIEDQAYKSVRELIHLLVRAVSKGSNLLLNIGPEPSGELPPQALERLKGIGLWMKDNAYSVDGCGASPVPGGNWGVSTASIDGKYIYLHILDAAAPQGELTIPFDGKVKSITFEGEKLRWKKAGKGKVSINLPPLDSESIDHIITITTSKK